MSTKSRLLAAQKLLKAITVMGGKHEGVMVCLYPAREVAEHFAQAGGEPVEDMHITLAYLGKVTELPDNFLDLVQKACQDVAAQQGPLVGEVGGIGRWAAGDDGDVIYASVDIPGSNEFRQKLVAALTDSGIPPKSNHGWSAHMTLRYVDDPTVDAKIGHVEPVAVSFDSLWVVVGDRDRHEVKFSAGSAATPQLASISHAAAGRILRAAQRLAQAGMFDGLPNTMKRDFEQFTNAKKTVPSDALARNRHDTLQRIKGLLQDFHSIFIDDHWAEMPSLIWEIVVLCAVADPTGKLALDRAKKSLATHFQNDTVVQQTFNNILSQWGQEAITKVQNARAGLPDFDERAVDEELFRRNFDK